MDPSQAQSDEDNDAGSLEKGASTEAPKSEPEQKNGTDSTQPQQDNGVIDASGGASAEKTEAQPAEHKPLPKRLWQKINVFLLLFIVLVLVSGGTVAALVIMDSRANAPRDDVQSQDLSESSLTDLANSTVTVGEPQHVLNVNSHAIFNGSVLVKGDVEVAGSIKIGEGIEIASISVSGESRFSQIQAEDLEVNGTASVQGPFTARSGVQVIGNSTFEGSVNAASITTNALNLSGDLGLTAHVTVSGPTPSLSKGSALGGGGTASINGTDTSGSVSINTGNNPPAGCFATINFAKSFARTPHVVVSPVGAAGGNVNYYVNRSTNNFSICASTPPPGGQNFGFDYWVAG